MSDFLKEYLQEESKREMKLHEKTLIVSSIKGWAIATAENSDSDAEVKCAKKVIEIIETELAKIEEKYVE